MFRVVPAHQGLDTGETFDVAGDLRLVVQHQTIVFDRLLQLSAEGQVPDVGEVLLRMVDGDPGAVALGRIHSDIGPLDELGRRLAVFGKRGDADAGVDPQQETVDLDVFRERIDQFQRLRARRRHAHPRDHDGELIAAEACDRIAIAQRALQAFANLLQCLIADLMTQRIVDLLEAVQVQDHEGDGGAIGFRLAQRLLDPLAEQHPVG